ncbi:MAG: lysylphosphatidylglycerol synthase domain-containing protein, partial [Dehalococcoidia bacterium]
MAKVIRRVRLIAIGRLLLLLAPWAFIAYLFRDVDATLDIFRDASVAPMVGALLLMLLVLASMALLWVRLVAHLNREVAEPETAHLLRAFARSWLARYLPGKVWVYGARVIHTDASVTPRRIVASSLVDEIALILGTATALGLGLWTWSLAGPVAGLPVLLVGLAGVVAAVSRLDQLSHLALRFLGRMLPLRWKRAGEELQRAGEDPGLGLRATALFTGSYLLNNLASGLAFVLVVASLGDIGWDDVPLLIGAYSLASVISIAALFAPAGLGVREAVLAGFITSIVASPVAASVVVLIRVVTIIADVLFV